MPWYQELLTTSQGLSEIEKEAEEIVDTVYKSMEAIANLLPPHKTTCEEVEEIVKSLDSKKAKDADSWKNNIVKEGPNMTTRQVTANFIFT